jgi:hypothetical protein
VTNVRFERSIADAGRAFFAWRTTVLKRASTPDLAEDAWRLVQEAWGTAYQRGRIDGFSLSAQVRGAIDALEETTALLRAWEVEHAAIELLGDEEEQRLQEAC